MVDSVLGSGVVTPGKCRRGYRSGLVITQDIICSHSPSKGALWVRRQPSKRFLRSCFWYRNSPSVIGINPQDRKRQERPSLLEGCQHRLLTSVEKRKTFRPPGGHIGKRQSIQVAASDSGATMGH